MRKTMWKHLIKTIQKNAVSFFAVSFIAAISIAIYIGLQGGATATLQAADAYFGNQKLQTMEITGATGITKEDIEEIAKWDNVVDGQLPVAADEVAVEERFAKEKGVKVGDEIELIHQGNLTKNKFQVTAIINQANFCCAKIDDLYRLCKTDSSAGDYLTSRRN